MMIARLTITVLFVLSACSTTAGSRRETPPATRDSASTEQTPAASEFTIFDRQRLFKELTDLSFHEQLGDEMIVRKILYAADDGMIIPAYFFTKDTVVQRPVILMVHGGIHGDFTTTYVPFVRSLVREGYLLVAPEYRGSTGYGREHYDAIDYGGKEIEDVISARDYLALFVPHADTSRMALLGWSHGGFIAIHAILRRPELFKAAVAHVPVADLATRIRTHSEQYHQLFVEQKGFGARLDQNPAKYIERSPIAHVRKLKTPLLVHAADNDDDVLIIENHNLRDSMRVAGMDRKGLYTYREWHSPPGGHSFSRVESRAARESWGETVRFLNRYLHPRSTHLVSGAETTKDTLVVTRPTVDVDVPRLFRAATSTDTLVVARPRVDVNPPKP